MIPALILLLQEAPTTQQPAPSAGSMWLPLVLVGLVFYFVLIGPERKNRKKRETMLAELKKGDRVMTSSGLYAQVAQVQGEEVTLQVADGVRLRFALQAVQTKIEPDAGDEKKDA